VEPAGAPIESHYLMIWQCGLAFGGKASESLVPLRVVDTKLVPDAV